MNEMQFRRVGFYNFTHSLSIHSKEQANIEEEISRCWSNSYCGLKQESFVKLSLQSDRKAPRGSVKDFTGFHEGSQQGLQEVNYSSEICLYIEGIFVLLDQVILFNGAH